MGERYLERVLTTTCDELVAVANRYLGADNAGVIVYRPEDSAPVAGDAGEMRELLDRMPRPEPLAPAAPYVARPLPKGPAPEFGYEPSAVRVQFTRNQVPLLMRHKPGAPLVHVGVFVLGGAWEENPKLAGLTTLTVRTALKGTTTRTALQIAEQAELLGGSVSGSTSSDSFGWSISVPTRYAEAAIELLADVVQHPTLGDQALDTERAIAMADVAALRDDMYRYPTRLATREAFAGYPYGQPIAGDESTLPDIDSGDIRRWHRERVLRSDCVIAIVGDVDQEEMARVVTGAFDDLGHKVASERDEYEWPADVSIIAEVRDRAQTALTMLFAGPRRNDPRRFSAAMLASVASGLGGRFFDELRDKRSLCYTVNAFASDRRLAGTFGAYIATSPEQEAAAREGLLAQFLRFREEPVTAEELERAQRYAIGVHAIRQQSGGAVLADIVDAHLFGTLSELETYEQSILAVTPESMLEVAELYFDPGKRVEGIVRGRVQGVSAPTP